MTTVHIHPNYQRQEWGRFSSFRADSPKFSEPDYIQGQSHWFDSVKRTAILALKILIFPWGLYSLTKAFLNRVTTSSAYLAQFKTPQAVNVCRQAIEYGAVEQRGLFTKEVVLQKNEQIFTGFVLGKKTQLDNGHWILYSPGNCVLAEELVASESSLDFYIKHGYNVLVVNGPRAGKCPASSIVENFGASQEVGLNYLEEAVRAKKIVLIGQSLGGAMIGQAILKHEFKSDVKYLVIRFMTFDRLSHIAGNILGWVPKLLIRLFGLEMDSVEASRKLSEREITEVVIKAEDDELMSRSSLLDALKNENLMKGKEGITIAGAGHNHIPYQEISSAIRRLI